MKISEQDHIVSRAEPSRAEPSRAMSALERRARREFPAPSSEPGRAAAGDNAPRLPPAVCGEA